MREARRQYHAGTVVPLATLVEAALSEALNEDVTLNMRRGKATDSATLARAISSLTSSGMDLEAAIMWRSGCEYGGLYFSPYFFDSLDPCGIGEAVAGILRVHPARAPVWSMPSTVYDDSATSLLLSGVLARPSGVTEMR